MRILSLVRQVLNAEESVTIRDGRVNLTGRKMVVDTMDEYGIEEALRLREKLSDVSIIMMAVGPLRTEEALRTALALGADRAILVETDQVETDQALDVIAVSSVMAQVAQREQLDLILCGGQQADWDSQGLGAAIAERLDWPQVTWTTYLAIDGQQVTGTHDTDEGNETFALTLPTIIKKKKSLKEQRYKTMPNILKSKKKELKRELLDSFGVSPKLKLMSAQVQLKERRRSIIDDKDAIAAAGQLVDLLRNEAKVIA